MLFLDEITPEATEEVVSFWVKVKDWLLNVGIKIAVALAIMIVAFWLINVLTKKFRKHLEKKGREQTLINFIIRSIRIVAKLLVIASLVGYVGIETSSITAVFTTLGLGVSLAVQGVMSNLAGGILITFSHPFKIGDYIETESYQGTVEDINLMYTHLKTVNNKVILIPNSKLTNNVITNYSVKDVRRLDLVIPCSYNADTDQVKEVIKQVINSNELILQDPKPFVSISSFDSSSIGITLRVWVKSSNYWDVNFYLFDAIKKAFDANNIEIPYNKLDVYLKNDTKEE